MNRTLSEFRTRLLFAFMAAALIMSSLSQRYVGHVLGSPDLDFYDYYFAARVVHEHPRGPLYDGATEGNPQLRSAPASSAIAQLAKGSGLDDIELYLYPPLLADLLIPLTFLPLHLAAAIWRVLDLVLIVLCVAALSRALRIRLLSFEFATFAVLAYAFWPMHEAISLGQASILMLALWTVGFVGYFNGKVALSAVVFALATSLKVTPILLLPLFVIWKDKRWIAWYVSSLALLLGAMAIFNGGQNMISFLHVMQGMGGNVPALQNKCIGSLLAWIYYQKLFTTASVQAVLASPSAALALVSKATSMGLYAFCLYLVWRRRAGAGIKERAGMMAMFALVTAVIAPVSWRHGYTVAIIPLAILWVQALRQGATVLRAGLLFLASVTVGSLVFDLATRLPLPSLVKIVCGSTWVCFILLLVLDVLWRKPQTMFFDQPDSVDG